MKLTTAQSYEILAKHCSYITELCDACGKGIGPVRITRKYENGEERRAAKTQQQRGYRSRADVEKTVCIPTETKDLQVRKSPLSTIPLPGRLRLTVGLP